MSAYIHYELWALFFFCLCGVAAAVAYDILKALRRVIPHSSIVTGTEDILYWIFCGCFLFGQIFLRCDGAIRSYAVLGIFAGAAGYHATISSFFVNAFTGILKVPVGGMFFLIKRLLFLWKRCKIFVDKRKSRKNNKRVHRFGKGEKQSGRSKKNPHGHVQHRDRGSDSAGSSSL